MSEITNQPQTPRPVPPDPARTRNSDIFTRRYLDSLLIETRVVDSALASTRMTFLGEDFRTPIMFGVIDGYRHHEGSLVAQAQAAAEGGTVLWLSSHRSSEEVAACVATGAKVILVIKPYADMDRFLAEAKKAQELGVFAVASDIDHVFGKDGELDRQRENIFAPRSVEQLKTIVDALDVPFVAKGILSVQDALKCKEAGVAAILVTHHHSIIDYAVPPLMILPEIRKAVGEDFAIIVDCGLDTGADTFKALALGADCVCTARAFMKCLAGGKEAFLEMLQTNTGELRHYLNRTNSPDIKHIDPTVIHLFPYVLS